MRVRLAVRIQHHPARGSLLPGLLESLQGIPDVRVVHDPDPRSPPATWRTHRACLEAMPAAATHLLVIQDDAQPCQRFAGRARAAIKQTPDRILCLFVPGFAFLTKQILTARQNHESVTDLPVTAFVPCVAIVYPAADVRQLLAYSDPATWPRARRRGHADDGVIADYCRARRIRPAATVPSLVQHRDALRSLAKPAHVPGSHRRAAWFADTPGDK